MMNSGFTIMAAVVLGMLTAFAATMLLGAIYFVIGLLTGIYGMCVIAPHWWQEIYSNLLYIIPVVGIVTGIVIAVQINKKSQETV